MGTLSLRYSLLSRQGFSSDDLRGPSSAGCGYSSEDVIVNLSCGLDIR